MSRIDWHAYLDGTLEPELRTEADQVLASDPDAQRRLENLKSFVAEIRRQGMTQEVPLARLHRSIPSSRPRFSWPRILIPSMAGVAALVIGLTVYNRPPASALESLAVQDYDKAAEWMFEGNGIPTKRVHLASAQLVGSERMPKAGCYCVKVNGELIHLAYSTDFNSAPPMKAETIDGKSYTVGANMVCFKACGLLWMTHGGTEANRWKVAKEAAAQLQS